MQDETTPPVPLKDISIQTAQAPVVSEQPVAVPIAAPDEPLKEPPALKEDQIPVKEEKPTTPTRSSASVMPVIFSIVVFVMLATCAYFVFKGM